MEIAEYIRKMPKAELHRHLSGAVRSEAMFNIASELGIETETDNLEDFRKLTSMYGHEPDFLTFLQKFKPRARFYKDRRLISEIVRSVIQDAAADNIIYMELRFSASHFSREMGFDRHEVSEQIISTARDESAKTGMQINFLMTLTRDLKIEENLEQMDIALHSDLAEYFAGIDIAGDELNIPLSKLETCIRETKDHGKKMTIHAGEAGPAANVQEALEAGAVRIGHGVHSFNDQKVLDLAVSKGAWYEVCPTSNIDTATIKHISELNLGKLLEQGIPITLNTDDPGISVTTLSNELIKVQSDFGLGKDEIKSLALNSISAAFIDENQKKPLHDRISSYE